MNVLHLSADHVKIWFFVCECFLKSTIVFLDKACERGFIDQRHMELHHEPIDKMN